MPRKSKKTSGVKNNEDLNSQKTEFYQPMRLQDYEEMVQFDTESIDSLYKKEMDEQQKKELTFQ